MFINLGMLWPEFRLASHVTLHYTTIPGIDLYGSDVKWISDPDLIRFFYAKIVLRIFDFAPGEKTVFLKSDPRSDNNRFFPFLIDHNRL